MTTKKEEIVEIETSKQPVEVNVLSSFRVEKVGDDSILYERTILPEKFAGQPKVKEFKQNNGKIIYYVEKQVKRYSDNVVKA